MKVVSYCGCLQCKRNLPTPEGLSHGNNVISVRHTKINVDKLNGPRTEFNENCVFTIV